MSLYIPSLICCDCAQNNPCTCTWSKYVLYPAFTTGTFTNTYSVAGCFPTTNFYCIVTTPGATLQTKIKADGVTKYDTGSISSSTTSSVTIPTGTVNITIETNITASVDASPTAELQFQC